ncbi:hypothetical protein OG2516_04431 [Oceanicola granulosus HTCC2516]|uniref:Uncharacterized protein n=1 Tax=Oceanicola granulosus (strain ATCC BAA-861 / DSM 15982 / KCTC 12143 / HTCC2516) TaxID=314256 RepID=Q2CD20_OCEGH|nr:hypothetical protein [Oceanicola granulosus]EAR50556.1 hypothetical protein OG2516_04431 [Oceanicola granulosus HTCC2516]
MDWQEITRNPEPVLRDLRQHFPAIDPEEVVHADEDEAVEKIARSHDLTRQEARRELDDILFAADLRRYRTRRRR